MKKAFALLAAIAVMCSFVSSYASTANALEATTTELSEQLTETQFPDPEAPYSEVTENNFVFHVYDDYAVLAECQDRDVTEAVIPGEVQGVPVVGITDAPFGFCRGLTTITLPDSLQYFSWFDLTCTTSVNSGSSEAPLPSVSKVIVSETNPYFTMSEGLLYSKDMSTVIGCPPAMGVKELKISDQTERIGDYAFAACYDLEKAIVSSNIKHINNNAFTACINLKSVELPESIISVSGDMFYFCTSLSEVVFKGNIEKIGYGAFNECSSLKEFMIPDTVTCIGADAFKNSGCIENDNGVHYVGDWVVGSDDNVKNAAIREGTVGIAEMSFFARNDLELFDVPRSVKYAGDLMFACLSGGETLSKVHYRSCFIGEKTLAAAKTATDIYIYDPGCEIFDSKKTIPASYKVSLENDYLTGSIVIHGYENSTAQAYAEKYGRLFEPIGDDALSGDVNGDGLFDIADLVLIQKWLLGDADVKLSDWKAADFCGDDRLDAFDFCLMRRKLVESGYKIG